jgi:transposase
VFDQMYSENGRPSIPPERLLKAQSLIALYSARPERQFCERLDYDLLLRFFLDMGLDDPSWDATVLRVGSMSAHFASPLRMTFVR